jgi:hypothetical protein
MEELSLEEQLVRANNAHKAAQSALFRIININPVAYMTGPADSGSSLPIVKAFREAQSVADRGVIAIADALDPPMEVVDA